MVLIIFRFLVGFIFRDFNVMIVFLRKILEMIISYNLVICNLFLMSWRGWMKLLIRNIEVRSECND